MTNSETAFPHLFEPLRIGQLETRNRIVMSPVGTRLASDGMVTPALREFYAARARGGVGLILMEACFVEPEGEDRFLFLHEDRFIDRLGEIVKTVQDNGAKIGAQLFHAGWRTGEKNARFLPPIPPAELSEKRIEELTGKFAQAAQRARQAGFDLIEIHAAHGYLLSQFLSPLGNKRTDEYGGDVYGRTRIVRGIIQALRSEVGPDFRLSCRINGAENVPGGSTIEDAQEIAPLLESEGLHLLSVSAGAIGSYPLTIPPSDTPEGCYTNLAAAVKSVVNVPVVTAGRINTPQLAEEILAGGKADLVAITRGLVADPELPNKSYRGEADRIRRCIACNVCLDTDYNGHIACAVNPLAGRESEIDIRSASQSRKVMVIGAGLAGLEAARIAALRGHQVALYEAADEMGGQWILASRPPHKQVFLSLVNWLSRELEILGVKIECGHRVTAEEVITTDSDVVVIATGAEPLVPPIEGFDRPEVVTAWQALRNVPAGERVLVIGGGATGLETAEFLAEQGKRVSVVEMLKAFGTDMGGTVYFHLMHRLKKLGVELFKNTEVKAIDTSGVTVMSEGKETFWQGFDTFVLALGVKSRNELAEQLEGKVGQIYQIGDAATPGNAADAMRRGFDTGIII
ncbi:MAG: FAD-dependent oxidoreductase [Dehalococcoidia bacterium]